MDPENVCAVVYGASPAPLLAELMNAVTGQEARPVLTLVTTAAQLVPELPEAAPLARFAPAVQEGPLGAGLRAAASTRARWTWLLDGWTVPAPDALGRLLAAVQTLPAPAPVLMASRVLDVAGDLHPDATPRHEIFEKEHSVQAAQRHLVQLRTAAAGSVLVDSAVIGRVGPPRVDLPAGLDMLEWSARVLRRWEDTGYLVPASRAVRQAAPAAQALSYWRGRARLVASAGWSPTEKLWETFLLGEALAGALTPGLRAARGSGRRACTHPSSRAGWSAARAARSG